MTTCPDCKAEIRLIENPLWAGLPMQPTCECLWITIDLAPGITTWHKIPPMVDKAGTKVVKVDPEG